MTSLSFGAFWPCNQHSLSCDAKAKKLKGLYVILYHSYMLWLHVHHNKSATCVSSVASAPEATD